MSFYFHVRFSFNCMLRWCVYFDGWHHHQCENDDDGDNLWGKGGRLTSNMKPANHYTGFHQFTRSRIIMHNCKDDGSNHRSLCEDQSHNHTMPHTPFISPVIDSIRAIYSQKLMSSRRKQTAQQTKWIQKVENNNCVAVAVIWCEFSLLTRWRYTSLKKQQAKATAATVAVVVTATATTNEEQEINFRVLRPSVCVRVHVSTLPRKS